MGSFQLKAFRCDRCKHEWVPRLKIKEKPSMCPKCKSTYWDKPRRIDIAKQQAKQKRRF